MAVIAVVHISTAAEEGNRTTEHALPVDLCIAVLVAIGCSSTNFFQKTVLATEILLRGLTLSHVSKLLLAVYQATKVRFLTLVALINGAAMVSELLWLSVEVVSDRC